jgi:hypothetical protein
MDFSVVSGLGLAIAAVGALYAVVKLAIVVVALRGTKPRERAEILRTLPGIFQTFSAGSFGRGPGSNSAQPDPQSFPSPRVPSGVPLDQSSSPDHLQSQGSPGPSA